MKLPVTEKDVVKTKRPTNRDKGSRIRKGASDVEKKIIQGLTEFRDSVRNGMYK